MTVSELLPTLVGIGAVVLAALFALLPLAAGARGDRHSVGDTGDVPDSMEERALVYRLMLDLEVDHQTGKLSARDLALQQADLLDRAASLLRDSRAEDPGAQRRAVLGGDLGEGALTVEEQVEREIVAARRHVSSRGLRPARSGESPA